MDKRKKIALLIILIVVIIVIYLIYNIYSDLNNNKSKVNSMVKNISELNNEYAEAKAWLKIDGTSIDLPVFQSEDNDRYLRHDRDNKETTWGELFLDYRCNLKYLYDKTNIIIYGHNTEQDTYFSSLFKYESKEFYKNNKIMKLATKDRVYDFEIFAVLKTDTSYFYIDTEFVDVEEYDNFVNDLKEKSIYDTNIKLSTNETILMLSTCDYTVENGRFVVVGRLRK